MPRYGKVKFIHPSKGQASFPPSERQPSFPPFQRRLEAALLAVPENVREGHGPSDKRLMPRAKVAAAWCSCLRLSGPDIARLAGWFSHTTVSRGSFRNWCTQREFAALVAEAEQQMIEALKAAYAVCWDDEGSFADFQRQFILFNEVIVLEVLAHVNTLAEAAPEDSHERNMHEVNHAGLASDYCVTWGYWSKHEIKRALRKVGLTVLKTVETCKGIFTSAEKEGNWTLARKVFDRLFDVASRFAAQADAKAEAEFKRQESRRAQRKKDQRKKRQKKRTK